MGNHLLSCKRIAREALPILKNNLVVPALFRTDYSKEFVKQGDTIQVKKPAVFEAKDFTDEVTIQEINQENVLEPAMIALAEKSGSTQALRKGSIGRIQGLENYMSQQVAVHKAGTFTASNVSRIIFCSKCFLLHSK